MLRAHPVPPSTAPADAQPRRAFPFTLPEQLDTPAAVVDLDVLTRNVHEQQKAAAAARVELRPHAKTHKSARIAAIQVAAGAAGISVATLPEAEYFAAAGIRDIFIAYPLWAGGDRRASVRALHELTALRVGIDSEAGARALASATAGSDRPLRVRVEVDCGQRRSGIAPDDVADLARRCTALGLEVVGAFTHPGHAYGSRGAVPDAARQERRALEIAGRQLVQALGGVPELSGGSTPTVATATGHGVATEIRPGTYVFGDAQQRHLTGLAADRLAFLIAARVVSRPRPGEAVVDAGSKALSSDRPDWLDGHGWLPTQPQARVAALTEEHAVVTGLPETVQVGDLLPVVPNHVCTAVNLAAELTVLQGGRIVDIWEVGARRVASRA